LEELWPKKRGADRLSLEEAFKEEQEGLERLVMPCIDNITKEGMLVSDEVHRLFKELVEASSVLDGKLKKDILLLSSKKKEIADLRQAVKDWLHRVRTTCWLPLGGCARIAFREVLSGQSQDDLAQKVEMFLVGKKGFTVESYLKPLSIGKSAGCRTPDDLALLYRLLECSATKTIEVADLWQAFKDCALPSPCESTMLLRFGRGLLGLHAMGLFAPQSGGRGGTGYSFDQWRLRKKHFGRVWLKAKQRSCTDNVSTFTDAVPESITEVRAAILERCQDNAKELPAWAQHWLVDRSKTGNVVPSLLKRQMQRPTGFDSNAKRARGEKGSRPRLFMA
jgi:hypothetical protein